MPPTPRPRLERAGAGDETARRPPSASAAAARRLPSPAAQGGSPQGHPSSLPLAGPVPPGLRLGTLGCAPLCRPLPASENEEAGACTALSATTLGEQVSCYPNRDTLRSGRATMNSSPGPSQPDDLGSPPALLPRAVSVWLG